MSNLKMLRTMSRMSVCVLIGVLTCTWCDTARAGLTLTAAGIAQGLSLSTFASNFPNSGGIGPLGIAFPTSGGVLVSDGPGNVRLFATDSDGQSAASVAPIHNFGAGNASGIGDAKRQHSWLYEGAREVVAHRHGPAIPGGH